MMAVPPPPPLRPDGEHSHQPGEGDVFSDEEEEYRQHSNVLDAVVMGDLEDLKAGLRAASGGRSAAMIAQMTIPHTDHDSNLTGPLMLHALIANHSHIVSFLFDEHARSEGSIRAPECLEGTFFALECRCYSMVLLLLSKGLDPNQQRRDDGQTLLHLLSRQRKPAFNFIKQLLKLKRVDPDIKDHAGNTPLHYVAVHVPGVAGREFGKLLRNKGCDLSATNSEGRTAAMITKNHFLREVLSLRAGGRLRNLGLSQEAEESYRSLPQEEQDRLVETPRELYEPSKLDAPLRPPKKLNQDEMDDMGARLCNKSVENANKNMAALNAKYIVPLLQGSSAREPLTMEEQQASVERLYDGSMMKMEETAMELNEKYLPEPEEKERLSEEAMQESVQRLHNQCVDRQKDTAARLTEKYLAPVIPEAPKRTMAQIQAAAVRMHDDTIAKTNENRAALWDKYVQEDKPFRATPRMGESRNG